jgi:hypothetical protein
MTTRDSKMEDKPFVGSASIDIKDGRSMKFRISEIASIFTAEALAIAETLEIIEKILGVKLYDFLGLGKRVKWN